MRGAVSKIKAQVGYSFHEILTLIFTALVIGFVFSFSRWGVDAWDAVMGVTNWAYFTALGFILLLLVTFLQKVVASFHGLEVSFSRSYTYLILPLIASFLTNGYSLFFIPPGITMSENLGIMLGRNRYRRGLSDFILVGIVGTFIPTIIAIIFSANFLTALVPEFSTLIFIYVLNSLIPYDFIFRPFDGGTGVSNGSALFYKSRSIFIYCFVFLFFGFLVVQAFNPIITIIFGVVVALAIALIWLVTREI